MNLQKNDSTTLEIFPIHFEFSGLPMVHINFVGIVVCCFDFTLTISPIVWLNVQLNLNFNVYPKVQTFLNQNYENAI